MPRLPEVPVTVVWKAFSPASGSLIGIVPEATRLPEPFTPLSSVTADTVGLPITAPSLVPLIVKLTCFVVPSTLVIVKVSTRVSPRPRDCVAAFATV